MKSYFLHVFLCLWNTYIWGQTSMGMCVCEGQGLMASIFLFSIFIYQQRVLGSLELTDLPRVTSQLAPQFSVSVLLVLGLQVSHHAHLGFMWALGIQTLATLLWKTLASLRHLSTCMKRLKLIA